MKKRVLAILMSLSLCVGMMVPAFAVETEDETKTEDTAVTTTEGEETPAEGEATAPEGEETPAEGEETPAPDAKAAADRLNELGLFAGVGTNEDGTPNYDLERTATRAEAITMLVKLLGKDAEAQAGTYETPFTDVADWAAPYVGYAYENGLSAGTSETTFGSADEVTATQYLTFVLRALGYEVGTDFQWDAAWVLSDELGVTAGEYNAESAFTRGDAVLVSATALDKTVKGEETKTLLNVIEENLAAAPTEGEGEPAAEGEGEETPAEGAEGEGEETPADGEGEEKTEGEGEVA